MTVGARVRLARLAAGLSSKEIARRLEVSLKTYERIERGERDLRVRELHRLAAITGQDLAFFGASLDEEERVLPHPLPVVNEEPAG